MCPTASGILWSPRADPAARGCDRGPKAPCPPVTAVRVGRSNFQMLRDNGHRLAAQIRRQIVDLDPLFPRIRRGGYSEIGADPECRVPIKMRTARSSAVPDRE